MFRVFVFLCTIAAAARAQSIGAALRGKVEDGQGLAVRKARVEIASRDTGAKLALETGDRGDFQAPALPPGVFDVTVSAEGFSPARLTDVQLSVGQSRFVTVTLTPAARQEEVTVRASAVTLRVDSDAGANYDAQAMNDLPMVAGSVGRNFRAQVYLTPGTAPSTAAHRPFAVSGSRNRNNNYLIDSNDYNEIEGGLLMGRAASEQLISTEAIDGMQVLTHNFKAEYGRQNGSVISIVTKRGTNEWRGLAYEYWRNSALGARNTFDRTLPFLNYNQFGGNLGGPVVKNKLFVFGNFETFLRRQNSAATFQTLTAAQRTQAVDAVKPLVALYPEPNLPGTNLFRANPASPGDQYSFVLRADWEANAQHRFFTRSTYLKSQNNGAVNASLARYSGDVIPQGHSLHHIYAPTAGVVNEARFNYTRFRLLDSFVDPVQLGNPAVNGETGAVFVNGLSPLGHFAFWGRNTAQNNFQWTDDLTLVRGAHTLKAGAAVRRLQLNSGALTSGFTGQLRFNSIADFLAARPATYNRNVGNPFIGQRATEYNAYFQDDWRIHPRLLLNVGLRYEYNTVPTEVNGLIAERYRFRPDRNNFAPRFGFAWRADRAGKTQVRGGYGIYYNVLELSFVGLTRFNPPLIANLVAVRPTLPNLLANAQQAIPSGLVIPDRNARQPYSQHYNLTVERELARSVTLSAGYVGTAGAKLPRAVQPNGGDGLAQALRPDATVGVVTRLETAATSRYDALQTSLNFQRGGLFLRAAYTYAKFLDTLSDFPSSNQRIEAALLGIDEANWRLNRGPSDFDLRHIGTVAYGWELPWLRRNRWLGGWSLNGIVTLQSGRPYTLFSGTDNRNGQNNNRILDLAGTLVRAGAGNRQAIALAPGVTVAQLTPRAGTLGTLGRNTERADRLAQFDVSAFKTFALTDRLSLQLRGEAFNLSNTVNYGVPVGILNSPNFGQATTALDSRQMQIALRLNF